MKEHSSLMMLDCVGEKLSTFAEVCFPSEIQVNWLAPLQKSAHKLSVQENLSGNA